MPLVATIIAQLRALYCLKFMRLVLRVTQGRLKYIEVQFCVGFSRPDAIHDIHELFSTSIRSLLRHSMARSF